MKPFGGQLRWALILYVFLISAMSYLDRVNLSIAGPTIQREFGLTNVQLGYVFSALIWGYALFQAPGGRLADIFGPRRVLTFGILWWSFFTALTALVPAGIASAMFLLILVRFVLGAGEAVMFPASNRLVVSWIPTQERGIANGIVFGGVGAGSALAPPLISWIIANWGWRWSFYLRVPMGIVMAIGWYLLARDTPQRHPWASKKELDHIEAGIPAGARGATPGKAASWGTIFGNKQILFVSLSYFAFGYTAWIFFTWFYKYLKDVRGLDLKASAFYSMLPFLAMTLCSPLGGWIADALSKRFGRRVGRCGLGVVGMAGAAVFITLGTQAESAQLATIFLALGIGAQFLSQSSYWAVTADIAGRSAGSVSGLMNMGNQTAGAITAILTPWIAQRFGWTASFLVAAGFCAMGALAWLLVNPNVRLEPEREILPVS
jgi:ACS family glucarate transporter-like MFS transporter